MHKAYPLPYASFFTEWLSYDPGTGIFVWRKSSGKRGPVGMIAGTARPGGYIIICIKRRMYRAHRIAWKISYGEDPPQHLDHINGDRHDNRIENLRIATSSANSRNARRSCRNSTGFKGVSYHSERKCFQAYIRIDGILKHLGRFPTAEEAHAAYCEAGRKLFGEFFNPG